MEFLQTARDLVIGAGDHARSRMGHVGPVQYKGDINPVTEVDQHNEAWMVGLLAERHPDHEVVAEEGTEVKTGGRHRWYIDPLDGTVNFAHGMPWFSVSAGLQVDGVTQVGAVYVPMAGELFTAVRGQGAWCNDAPIHVSDVADLQRAVLGTGFPYDTWDRVDDVVTPLRAFLQRAQGIRRVGSAAMDLCQVACGRYDGFWELGLQTWDVCAGFLLVREAGGQVTDFKGHPGELVTRQVLVTNTHLHPAMMDVLQGGRRES